MGELTERFLDIRSWTELICKLNASHTPQHTPSQAHTQTHTSIHSGTPSHRPLTPLAPTLTHLLPLPLDTHLLSRAVSIMSMEEEVIWATGRSCEKPRDHVRWLAGSGCFEVSAGTAWPPSPHPHHIPQAQQLGGKMGLEMQWDLKNEQVMPFSNITG